MKSLDSGETAMRGVRVPDPLWERVEKWAATRGEVTSDALRALLEQAVRNVPSDGVIVRPPMKWMLSEYKHACFQKRPRRPVVGCSQPWSHELDQWVFLKITENSLTFDDLLMSVTTHAVMHHRGWYRVRETELTDIALAFQGNEARLKVHHLLVDQGPRLVRGSSE